MNILALKILASPLLIGAASLVGRRWGPAVGGWLVGLPLTSGPVAFFLALDHGNAFAAKAAEGSLAGTAAQALFSLAYAFAAKRTSWSLSFCAGVAGFASGASLIAVARLPLLALFLTALGALALALFALPRYPSGERLRLARPRWDIPLRMLVATALVLGLTQAAPMLGARLAGTLATFPVFAAVLSVFAHHVEGKAAAARVLRGLLLGLFGFVGFFYVLAGLLERTGIAAGFLLATAVALATQGVSLAILRRAAARAR
ncbi:MAG TPA: hypothetical protein VGR91_10280 [Stellaceae bacterium]|nr:hypothetical protein [Stellaceae bacterium]